MLTFQQMIVSLQTYWAEHGCVLLQPLDVEVGAATFHPATFLKALGSKPWRTAFVQPCRRPTDGRYGMNPNRVQQYYQFQVLLKPVPDDIMQLYLGSLEALGLDMLVHDVRFVEDNWASPTLGAWGLGWEVWLDGMEVTQFTYFQQVGGIPCDPISGEITYGLERLAMFLQGVDSLFDLVWTYSNAMPITYGDLFLQQEQQMSAYNFELAPVDFLHAQFDGFEQSAQLLLAKKLPIPSYELLLKASHVFNLLDARKAIAVTERQRFILRVRHLAQGVAQCYREQQG